MRNLSIYPLTANEVIELLARLKDATVNENRMGDIRPLALSKVIEFINLDKEEFDDFLNGKHVPKDRVRLVQAK